MTFAIIRRGGVADRVQAATLRELADWFEARRRRGDELAILTDEALHVGERVEVDEVTIGLATRAGSSGGARARCTLEIEGTKRTAGTGGRQAQ